MTKALTRQTQLNFDDPPWVSTISYPTTPALTFPASELACIL